MPLNVDQELIDAVKAAIATRVVESAASPLPANAVRSFRWRSSYASTVQDSTQTDASACPYITGGPTGGAMRPEPATFRGTTPVDECVIGVPGRREVVVKIVFDTVIETTQTPLEAAVLGSLYAAGPKLGIAWVADWSPRITRQIQNNAETGFVRRMVVTFAITVNVRPSNVALASE